jgi:hypothetical protein
MKYKVTHKATGKVHYLTADEVARIPRAAAARKHRHSFSPVPADMDRNTAIKLIREALKKRSVSEARSLWVDVRKESPEKVYSTLEQQYLEII